MLGLENIGGYFDGEHIFHQGIHQHQYYHTDKNLERGNINRQFGHFLIPGMKHDISNVNSLINNLIGFDLSVQNQLPFIKIIKSSEEDITDITDITNNKLQNDNTLSDTQIIININNLSEYLN
jgi:hypothetical protein